MNQESVGMIRARTQQIKESTRLEKAKLSREKQEEKKGKALEKLMKPNIKQKLVAKSIIRSSKPTLTLKEREPENVWKKQNMFFKEFTE